LDRFLEDQVEDVCDEDYYACQQADMAGDTVSLALDFEELAAGCSPAYGDEGKGESDDGKE
jgi:hypothetical protein